MKIFKSISFRKLISHRVTPLIPSRRGEGGEVSHIAKLILLTILFITPLHIFSQCNPTTFKKIFYQNDSTLNPANNINNIITATDSSYLIGGSQITKTDNNANNLWNGIPYNNYNSTDAIPYYAPDGRYFILEGNFHLTNIDENDNIIWQKYLVDTTCYCTHPKHIIQTTDGGFIIIGTKTINDTTFYRDRIFIVKTNANGDTTITKTIAKSPFDNDADYIQQTPDGGYIIVANIEIDNATQNFKVGIIKLDNNLQQQSYSTSPNSIYYLAPINAIKTNDSATAIIAAMDSITDGTTFIKINQSGTITTSNIYIGLKYNGGLAQLPNNTYLIAMRDSIYNINENTNTIITTKSYNGTAGEKIPINTIQPTCDGGYILAGNTAIFKNGTIICGSTFNFYQFYSYLIKTDSTLADVPLQSGINEIQQTNTLTATIYPNPFSNQTTITFSQNNTTTITITNALGNQIKTVILSAAKNLTLEKENLTPGIYFLNIKQGNNTTNKKIIIQ